MYLLSYSRAFDEMNAIFPRGKKGFDRLLTASPLAAEHEAEVQQFLSERPIHTVNMRSLISDNGLHSKRNRGQFYGCRDEAGRLEGIALIGRTMLIEARATTALAALAQVAQSHSDIRMIMGEQDVIEKFWQCYAPLGQTPRKTSRELLLELRWPVEAREEVPGLRLATPGDLEAVLSVQAEMARQGSGVNPLEVDPQGFRMRAARRIDQARIWVWREEGRLLFKADVMAETPEMIYLECYVHPAERGKGDGLRCMSQLTRNLLQRADALCLLVNEQNLASREFYRRLGYKVCGYYSSIFFREAKSLATQARSGSDIIGEMTRRLNYRRQLDQRKLQPPSRSAEQNY